MLAHMLGEKDDISLRKKISYYNKRGYLQRLTKGLYAISGHPVQLKEFAAMVYAPSYISFETALYHHGIIFQVHPQEIDIAYKKTQKVYFDSLDITLSLRSLKTDILMNPEGLEYRDNYTMASAERAFLDMIYLHASYYFDHLDGLDLQRLRELVPLYKKDTMMLTRIKKYFPHYDIWMQ
jgi:hypothetical protein